MHSLVLGMTMSGKTTLMKKLCIEFQQKGFKILVLDSFNDPGWPADFVTDDRFKFLDLAKRSRNCILMVDEAGDSCGQYQKESNWLATQSRHWGHSSFFASQRLVMIGPTVRTQTGNLYLFNISRKDSKDLADEWNKDILTTANKLRQGEYFFAPRFGDVKKYNIFLDK